MSRVNIDRLDNIQTATQDGHNRKFFRHIFYQSEFRTGRFGEPGPGVIVDGDGIKIVNDLGETTALIDLDGSLWLMKAGVLTEVQTFDDGGGHNVLYL